MAMSGWMPIAEVPPQKPLDTPSTCMLRISKPRATNNLLPAPSVSRLRPVVCDSTSSSEFRLKSSMRWRVTTVTDWGMSRNDSADFMMLAPGAAYECEPLC